MRLIIDLQALQTGSRYRGIGQYSVSLVREMLKIRGDHEILLLINNYSSDGFEYVCDQFKDLIDSDNVRIFRALPEMIETSSDDSYRIEVSEEIRNIMIEHLKPDAVLLTSLFEGAHEEFVANVASDHAYVSAVIGYDLIPLISPQRYLTDKRIKSWYMRKIDSLRKSDLILSISKSARREFEEHLDVGEDIVKTISTACSEEYSLRDWDNEHDEFLHQCGITKPFILYSGAPDERKNIRGLLAAFSKLEKSLSEDHQVVLVGKYNDVDKNSLLAFGKKLGIEPGDLIFPGFISNDQLSFLYSKCELFVFPSFHEGFGLPVLEAISCGAPTICSNTSSLPEVLDFPEAMFDPSCTDSISACMTRVLTDSDFKRRLIAHGLEQAKKFSWLGVAETVWQCLERAVSNRPGTAAASLGESSAFERLKALLTDVRCDEQTRRWVAESLVANENEVDDLEVPDHKLAWRIEGPFDSSYSLALLNRETARALNRTSQKVVMHSTEGPGDYDPDLEYLKSYPDIEQMYLSSKREFQPDIVSRNLYPPRTTGMNAKTRIFHHYAWEEAGFPREWAQNFNAGLDGLTSLSEHVRKVLIDNGVALPLPVSGCGVDHWRNITPEAYPIVGKSFRFLHVSSCFPRKGIDALFEAYGRVFQKADDVSLVIKTFNNPHNNVRDLLAKHREMNPDYPDVHVVFEDLSTEHLKSVYEQCHALVAPSKAEGFGLPIAEAMLSGLPVITTAWGGQLDFCNQENSWLVDYKFAPAQTHFNLPLSVWAEPDVDDLAKKMRDVYEADESVKRRKVSRGIRLLDRKFKWDDVASRLLRGVAAIDLYKKPEKLKIGWVSTWNQKCGIATYSEHLICQEAQHDIVVFAPRSVETTRNDSDDVIRCWNLDDKDSLSDLWGQIKSQGLDALVIQMNTYFYDFESLRKLLEKVKAKGILVSLTLHATTHIEERKAVANLRPCLDLVDRVVVHSIDDLNRLKAARVVNNAMILPHGILDTKPSASLQAGKRDRKVIATYGFALPNKGIEQLIEAFVSISKHRNDVDLLLLNAEHTDPVSARFIESVKQKIKATGLSSRIRMVNDFLDDQECIDRLSEVDVIAMPYQKTGESSSGAVKIAIASRSSVVVTPLSIFDDVNGAVDYFEGKDPGDIEAGVLRILNGGRQRTDEDVEEWCLSRSYSVISKHFFEMINSLVINEKFNDF